MARDLGKGTGPRELSPSVFRRVTRFSPSAAVNPRENRLTEVTAAVLETVDGAPELFVGRLLSSGCDDARRRQLSDIETRRRVRLLEAIPSLQQPRVDVRTQLPTHSGRFVDLEVLLRPPIGEAGRGVLLWVEVKHAAALHGDQLDAYLQDISMRHPSEDVERVVVLLAPRDWTPSGGHVPCAVIWADWQQVGRVVSGDPGTDRPAEQRWLAHEYIRYLEEEGLTDPAALNTASALALMEYNAAWDATAGICEHADASVQQFWGSRGDHYKTRGNDPRPAFGPGYWAIYPPHSESAQLAKSWRGGWFEWGMRETYYMEGVENPRGSWAFMAGATLITKDNPTKVAGNEEWFARRAADGFAYFWTGGYYRLARLMYPDELLARSTLEEQGLQLGAWVRHTFEALGQDVPSV